MQGWLQLWMPVAFYSTLKKQATASWPSCSTTISRTISAVWWQCTSPHSSTRKVPHMRLLCITSTAWGRWKADMLLSCLISAIEGSLWKCWDMKRLCSGLRNHYAHHTFFDFTPSPSCQVRQSYWANLLAALRWLCDTRQHSEMVYSVSWGTWELSKKIMTFGSSMCT